MIYKGSRLKALVQSRGGMYSDLAERMTKYKSKRKNSSDREYRLGVLYADGHNITINTLSALMKETNRPINYFVDFEPNELQSSTEGVSGNNNIINSMVSNDAAQRIEHLTEVVHLKDQLITEKERVIALKDSEIEQWKKRYDDLIKLAQFGSSDKSRT